MDVKLQHHLWEGGEAIALRLPHRWRVKVLHMRGDDADALDEDDYRKSLSALGPLVKGKKEICILFDDLTRPTRAYEVLPCLLEVLEGAGVRDEQVRFICATGTHAALDSASFRKKLGEEALERFPVYNHNAYENCDNIGKTNLGTPVVVNREYLSCDVRIGIGSFQTHPLCGFGGGCKIVLPGVSHIDTVTYHHGTLGKKFGEAAKSDRRQDSPLLEDVREYGRIARLDAKIDVLVNTRGEHVGLYAGPPEGVYAAMMGKALRHYGTDVPGKADIVFANAYTKASEAGIAVRRAAGLLKYAGGDVVVLCDIGAGQVVHYLLSRFGNNTWGRLASVRHGAVARDSKVRRLFVFSRHKDLAGSASFGEADSIIWVKDIDELIERLDEDYKKRDPDVYILPDATIQLV